MPEATLLSCKFKGRVFISIQVVFVSYERRTINNAKKSEKLLCILETYGVEEYSGMSFGIFITF